MSFAKWMFPLCLLIVTTAAAQENDRLRQLFKIKPNPNSFGDLFAILRDPEIAEELEIDPLVFEKIDRETRKLILDSTSVAKVPETKEEQLQLVKKYLRLTDETIQSRIDEVLTPEKLRRLKEIGYRIETDRFGFAVAIEEGWLGEAIELSSLERTKVLPKIAKIEAELTAKIRELKAAAEVSVLAELPPDARQKVIQVIGKPFYGGLKTNDEITRLMHTRRQAERKEVEE